jgi:hypothetical protein
MSKEKNDKEKSREEFLEEIKEKEKKEKGLEETERSITRRGSGR